MALTNNGGSSNTAPTKTSSLFEEAMKIAEQQKNAQNTTTTKSSKLFEEAMKIAESQKQANALPSLKNTPTESYNVFQRLSDSSKRESYKQAQANSAQAKANTVAEGKSILESLGKSESDFEHASLLDVGKSLVNVFKTKKNKDKSLNFATTLNDALKGLNIKEIDKWGKSKGLSEEEIAAVKQYIDAQNTQKRTEDITEFGKEHPYYGSVYSTIAKPGESLANVTANAVNYVTGNPIENYDRLNSSDYTRAGVTSNMGKVGSFLYNTGMSVADMGMSMATGAGPAVMGLEKASGVLNDAVQRNLTPNQIALQTAISGVTTALTEKIPMGKWEKIAKGGLTEVTAKELAKVVLASAGTEGAQEMAEDVADMIADKLIAGDKSSIDIAIRNNKANGMSDKDAKTAAWKDWVINTGLDGLAGALSGAVMGGGTSVLGAMGGNNANINAQEAAPEVENQNVKSEVNIDEQTNSVPENNTEEVKQRSYKDLLMPDTFDMQNNQSEGELTTKELLGKEEELWKEISELDKQLKSEIDATEFDGDKKMADLFKSYTEKGKEIDAQKQKLIAERNEIQKQISERREKTSGEQKAQREKELAEYKASDFKPATKTEYEGFDISKGTNGDVQEALDNGTATIVEMSPEEYLRRVAYEIFNKSTFNTTIKGVESTKNISKYAQEMKNGSKFPILSLTYSGGVGGIEGKGQEGRTRALAAYEAGIDVIPVAIIGKDINTKSDVNIELDVETDVETDVKTNGETDIDDEISEEIKAEIESENITPVTEETKQQEIPSLKTEAAKDVVNTVEEKVYEGKKVSNKELDKMINSLTKMFSRGENTEQLKSDLKAAINEYEDTHSDAAYNKVVSTLAEMEKTMKGSTYTTQRSKNKRADKVKTYSYPTNYGTVTENVMSHVENVKKSYTAIQESNKHNNANLKGQEQSTKDFAALNPDKKAWKAFNNLKDSIGRIVENPNEENYESAIENAEKLIKSNHDCVGIVNSMLDEVSQHTKKNNSKTEIPGLKSEKAKSGYDNSYTTNEKKLSQTAQVSYRKSEIYGRSKESVDFLEQMNKEGKHDVDIHHWKDTNEEAVRRLESNPEEVEKSILESKTCDDIEVFESVYLIGDKLKNKDYTSLRKLSVAVNEKAHKAGQFLNALSYFGRTAAGTIAKGEAMANANTKKFVEKAKETKAGRKKLEENAKLARAIDAIENEPKKSKANKELTREELRERVVNTLKNRLPGKTFTESQIDTITTFCEERGVSEEEITAELKSVLSGNDFFELTKDVKDTRPRNQKFARALKYMVQGENANEKTPKTKSEIKEEIVATLSDEYASVLNRLSDKNIDFLVELVMDSKTTPVMIADELEYFEKNGEFYTIDESIPLKEETNKQLDRILAEIGNKNAYKAKEKVEKNPAQIRREIEASLKKESASVLNFNDSELDFITTLVSENVGKDTIRDEIEHWLRHGEFYTIDESIEAPKAKDVSIEKALSQVGKNLEERVESPKPAKTFDEIREAIKNTLDGEMYKVEFSDAEIEMLAHMKMQGYTVNELTDVLNRKLANGNLGMSDADMERIVELFRLANSDFVKSKDKAKFMEQAYAIAAQYVGEASFMDKWNAWRYMSMLGNPKTMWRNVQGNFLFRTVTNAKDNIAALMEEAYSKTQKGKDMQRTKAILTANDKGLIKSCDLDFDNNAYQDATRGGNRYNMKSEIEKARRIFKNRFLEGARNSVSDVLEKSDIKAMQKKYARSLASYLKANGKTDAIFTSNNEADIEFMDKARAYAVNEAMIATFHEYNSCAAALNQFSKNMSEGNFAGKTVSFMIEANLPFKQTPSNILKQGVIEYNPAVQFTRALLDGTRRGKDANVVINDLAKGMTGGMLFVMGMFLASKGILVSQRDDDDDPFSKGSDFAIKFKLNGKEYSYTIDWTAPASLPLFVGATYNKIQEEGFNSWGDAYDAIASIGEPVIEMSMLQGLKNTITSINGAVSKNEAGSLATNIIGGYLSQIIPTVFGQVARSIDDTRRTTSTETSSSKNPAAAALEKQGKKILNKLPVLSKLNAPVVDVWGNEVKNEGIYSTLTGNESNFVDRLLYNTLSSGYINDLSYDKREMELLKLEDTYKSDPNNSGTLIPSLGSRSYNGERMDDKTYAEYSKQKGTELGKAVDTIIKYDGKVDESDLAYYTKEIESFSNALARARVLGNEESLAKSNTYKREYEAYKQGGYKAVVDYYIKRKLFNDAGVTLGTTKYENVYNEYSDEGIKTLSKIKAASLINGSAKEKDDGTQTGQITSKSAYAYFQNKKDIPALEKGKYIYMLDETSEGHSKAVERAYENGGYKKVYELYYLKDNADADNNGNMSKTELSDYLRNKGYSQSEIDEWWTIVNGEK